MRFAEQGTELEKRSLVKSDYFVGSSYLYLAGVDEMAVGFRTVEVKSCRKVAKTQEAVLGSWPDQSYFVHIIVNYSCGDG